MRRILLGAATVIVLAGIGISAWIWHANYRAWHNPKAAPLFEQIEPADGATVYESDLWIRWSSPEATRARVLWRKEGAFRVRATDAGTGQELLAHLAQVNAGAKYEYIVEETRGDQTLRSSVRTLNIKSGLAFDPVVEQTVEHDYDQTVKLTLRNRSPEPVVVSAKALKRFADLPADITGYGSVEVPAQLAPNSTLDLRLAVTADDATRGNYEIPIEAAGAYVTARFHVHIPQLNFSFRITEEDPKTLAKTIYIHHKGETLSDFTVRVVPANQQDLELQPAVNHAVLHADSGVYLKVAPILYLEFQSLKAEIEASAAGQTVRFPLEFRAPPGVRLIAFRSATMGLSSAFGRICTNHPNTCSELPGHGNGPAASATPAPAPEAGACDPPKCNMPDACEVLEALLHLIKTEVEESRAPETLSDAPKMTPLFATFIAEFDPLLSRLRNVDLACRFNQGVDPGVEELLRAIVRDRNGFRTLNAGREVPSLSDCAYETLDPRMSREYGPPSAQEGMRCADYHAIEDIKDKLQQLASVNCFEQKGSTQLRCPETETLEAIKYQAEGDKKLTNWLKEVARKDDPELTRALEDTETAFDNLASFLGKLIKAAKTCEKIRAILQELADLLKAIRDINNAGCDTQRMAKGFDDLVRSAGKLAENFPIPDLELKAIVKVFAQNKSFFQNSECAIDPECRWNRQFRSVSDYSPNCPVKAGGQQQ